MQKYTSGSCHPSKRLGWKSKKLENKNLQVGHQSKSLILSSNELQKSWKKITI